MSDDEQLEQIFDGVGENGEERMTEQNVEENCQEPSSSRDGEGNDDEDMEELVTVDDDENLPSEPIGTATLTTSSLKKRPPLLPSPEGEVKTKRVRIMDEDAQRVENEFIEQLVVMGYDRPKVIAMYLHIGGTQDTNLMIDRLSQQEEQEHGEEQRTQTTSPFQEPIQCSSSSIMEHIENLNELARPSPQKPSPSFVDLCDEHDLRKHLNLRTPSSDDSCDFVVHTATLMAQRLSQVNYISKVARLAESIFAISDLYSHYKNRLPREPASDMIDRRGIIKENDAPFGVLIDVAEAFVNNDGLQHISDRIKDPAMSIRDVGYLCSILADLSWMMFPRSLDETMAEAAEKMRAMMKEYSEKEIRDERTRHEIFEAARKVCKSITPGITVSPRYEFIERLMLCGNMEAKKNAIDELAMICDHEMRESYSVRRWMKSRNILPILLSDHLDHPEYAAKIGPILRKLAPVMSEREFRGVWCLQKGRGGISPETFSHILSCIASGFEEDQIVMLFKYFKKQLKRMPSNVNQQDAFRRVSDIVTNTLSFRHLRPVIPAKDRQLFVECYIRMFDRFALCTQGIAIHYSGLNFGSKIAECLRGQPMHVAGYALSKLAREVAKMKENDVRFPFYFVLIHFLCNQLKQDMPMEYPSIGPLLAHHKFAEKCTRMMIGNARMTLAEIDRLDHVVRASEDMQRARQAYLKQAAAATASVSAPDADAAPEAASASSQQPSPVIAASAAVPPPSAVTPISNGPSPKRDGSPAGTSAQESPEMNGQPAAPPSTTVRDNERKEDTVSVCTPPCTPEPLRVSVARLGTKEWDKEACELATRVTILATEVSVRLVQYSQLVMFWQEDTLGDEPIPSCSLVHLSQSLQEEMFGVLVDSARNGLHKRIIQITPFWPMVPQASNNTHTVMKTMLRALEHKPVFRALITRLCSMTADLVSPFYVDIVRATAEMCFASDKYNKSTDWLEAVLRFLWRATISKLSDTRDRAVDVLKVILAQRYNTLRLIEVFSIARFNEAHENFARVFGRPRPPLWEVQQDEEDDDDDDNMVVDKEEYMRKIKQIEERMEENGEQAVDLTLEPREKRARSQVLCRDRVEAMLRRMKIEAEPKGKEEAEFRLSRTISFVRRMITYGYLEAKCSPSLVVRERAIPGEVAELTLRVHHPMSSANLTLFVCANESVNVFGERLKKILPHPINFPRGYKIRHHAAVLQWERGWASVCDQMNMNNRGGADECQVCVAPSPFNDDYVTEASARREHTTDNRMHLQEKPLGVIANETKFASILLGLLDSQCGWRASSHLQEAVLHCLQQLPLQPLEDEEALMEVCTGALSLQKPHEALFHLITLLSALLPPRLSREEASAARRTLAFLRQTTFVPRFMAMIREVDDASSLLCVDALALFHEVCLTLVRLFYLNDSGKHRAYKANRDHCDRLAQEPAPIDTSPIAESLKDDELPPLLRTLLHLTWAIIAPRRLDVEKEMNLVVMSPSVRLQYAKEKKVENHMTHRRTQLARASLTTVFEFASRYGNWERNVNTLLSPSSIDGSTTAFWRDVLMHVGSTEHCKIQHETRVQLASLIDSRRDDDERVIARRVLVRLVFELGRPVWGPSAAVAYSSSGRNPIEMLKLAEKVVKATRRDEFEEGLLEEWIDLQIGFISEDRPMWNARCHMSLHVQLLQELLKKQERETMAKAFRRCLQPLFTQALFPFAANIKDMEERYGSYPSACAVGHGLAEGDVRRKYMDIVLFYCHEFPEVVLSTPTSPLGMLDFLAGRIHGNVLQRRSPIHYWEKAERHRRQRAESFCGPQLNLAQRLHNLSLRETDVRMVKGLLNPSYMCYANSVLQQLVFMPGVCEALFALGDLEQAYGDMTDDEEIKNGGLLRVVASLFSFMLFSAEQSMSAELVLQNMELPSGGSVREQQDCVEFFLTLIDKCDSAAEKFNRPPIFKPFLEGVMGYEYACKTCKHRHRGADESFTALNLEIHGTTVGDCLDHFMDGALLEGASAAMCEQCGEKRTTLRIGALRSAPSTLCIQLKRFSTYDSNGGKLNSKVDVPRELDLTRFSEAVRTATDEQVEKMFGWFDDTQDEPVIFTPPPDCPVHLRYRLVGVIVHSGQLGNGHYTSYVKERRPVMRGRPWFDQWLLANDDRVSVQEDRVNMEWQGSGEENTPSAYLLWYEMIEDEPRDTVAEPHDKDYRQSTEGTVAAMPSIRNLAELVAQQRAECDWMDIGLGGLGVLEGPMLALWKSVPERNRQLIVMNNVEHQLGRDVLTESYAKFLLQMLEMAREHAKKRPTDESNIYYRKILFTSRRYVTECLWRTREMQAVDADNMINHYRLFIANLLKESTELCKEWLRAFYDPLLHAISEETREFTTHPLSIRAAVSSWWWLAQQAVTAVRGDAPALVEAYCSHMVECLRIHTLRMDGFTYFFTMTVGSPHCVDFHIKHNILVALVNVMFYYNKKTMTWGLHADFTARNYIPIISGLFQLYHDAIERDLINEDDVRKFVEKKLYLAMGPMTRHGEEYLMRMVDLLNTTLRAYGERDERWTGRIAQAILNCLKIDPHRANGLFYVVTTVGKSLNAELGGDFYDQLLGAREADAAEDGRIYPGIVHLLEDMIANRRESRLIQMVDSALTRTIDSSEGFRERADAYAPRLDAIRIRLAEWKDEEAAIRSTFEAQLSMTRTMLMGAEAIGMLPLDACGPIPRPAGGCNGRGDYDMMQVSDDEMDDEDDDLMSDEEEYSEGEGPVNLSNNR